MKRIALLLLGVAICVPSGSGQVAPSPAWSTWNGVTVGSSTGNNSSMNGKAIGTAGGGRELCVVEWVAGARLRIDCDACPASTYLRMHFQSVFCDGFEHWSRARDRFVVCGEVQWQRIRYIALHDRTYRREWMETMSKLDYTIKQH